MTDEREEFEQEWQEWTEGFRTEIASDYSLERDYDEPDNYEMPATYAGWIMWQARGEREAKKIAELRDLATCECGDEFTEQQHGICVNCLHSSRVELEAQLREEKHQHAMSVEDGLETVKQ